MDKRPEQSRKKRMTMSLKTKQEIYQRKNDVPSLTIDQLSAEYSCDRSTISKILKEKEKWLSMQLTEPEEKKMVNRPAKFIDLENAMAIWTKRDCVTSQTIINCWRKTEIVLSNEWNHLSWNTLNDEFEVESEVESEVENEAKIEAEIEAEVEAKIEVEIKVENLLFKISSDYMNVMSANNYIRIDDTLETEEVVLDKSTIIEEVLYKSDFSSSNEESDVEIKEIPHSVVLEQCSLLIQYLEQQEPVKFVKDQDLSQLRSLLRRIRLNVFQSKEQRKETDFF
ncbi:6010_t:CDS:2 [Racocetra fulgida]|uniref:6010_t:CDS:1 n=1 Tax=Racocetra fulgida TaxID=60492 RepID=A0A9N9B4F9_9GLOM|nr:6010_t:CDS:2 [Racocetra fulgida]